MTTRHWLTEVNGNFNTAADWTGSTAPGTADTAVIDATGGTPYIVTVTLSTSIAGLQVNSADATLEWSTASGTKTLTVSGATTLSLGTINIGAAGTGTATTKLAAKGGFSETGGTLLLGQGTFQVGATSGNFAISGGTFTESGGTLTVTNTADFTAGTDTISGGTLTASNLTVDGTSNTLTLSGGTTTTTVNNDTSNTIATGDTVAMSGGAVLDYTHAGASTGGGVTIAGELTGSGTVDGTLLGSGGSAVVDASGGTLDLTSAVGASSDIAYQVGASSTLQLDGSVGSGNTFTFATSSGDLALTTASSLTANIVGMNVGTLPTSPTNYIDIEGHTVTITGGVAGQHQSGTSGTVTLSDGSTLSLSGITNPGTGWYVDDVSDGHGGDDIFLSNTVCFAAGTRITTAAGEIAVENLAEGDLVVTHTGEQQPVKWVGYRRLDLTRHPHPTLAAPVRIRRHAFGNEQPHRDLVLSPDHCLFVDGKLIPAKLLINDMTIVQERDTPVVEYYHVELERHSVLLAEGLPADSYLDTGNRAFFSNAGLALVLHPEFHLNAHLKCWETDACAPLAVSQEMVRPVWQSLVERAESLGYQRPDFATTTDPELRLVVDGRAIRPLSSDAGRYVFTLPAGTASVHLTSRASVPSHFEAYRDDWRHLGVAVRRIVVRDSTGTTELPPDHPGLTQGWHKVERNASTMWRWMDGDAVLPVRPTDGPALLEIHVASVMKHVVKDVAPGRLAA